MRIVVYLYEPSDGGLDRVAILLANELLRRGIDVEMWMGHVDGPLRALIHPAMTVRRIPTPRWHRRFAMLVQFPVLAMMIRRRRPDIVYSAGIQSNRVVGIAAWGTRSRAVGRISNPIVKPGRTGFAAWARRIRFRALARICAMTIVMGEGDRETLAAPGPLRGRRITLLPRPTVTPVMGDAAKKRRIRGIDEPWRLLMVGRLSRQKGHVTAFAALAGMKGISWRLTIAGEGPLRDILHAECERLEIGDRVEFLGFVSDADRLADLMADADLVLQPSLWEGFSGVTIEALACGAGVVATDCTPNIHGLLADAGQHAVTPIGDIDAFRRAIAWALANPAKPERLAVSVKPFAVDIALEAHVAAFRSLLGQTR